MFDTEFAAVHVTLFWRRLHGEFSGWSQAEAAVVTVDDGRNVIV